MSHVIHTDLNTQRNTQHRGAWWPWSLDPRAKRVSQGIGAGQGRQAPAGRVSPLTRTDTLQFRAAIGSKALSDQRGAWPSRAENEKAVFFITAKQLRG